MKNNYSYILLIFVGLMLFGCHPNNSKNTAPADALAADSVMVLKFQATNTRRPYHLHHAGHLFDTGPGNWQPEQGAGPFEGVQIEFEHKIFIDSVFVDFGKPEQWNQIKKLSVYKNGELVATLSPQKPGFRLAGQSPTNMLFFQLTEMANITQQQDAQNPQLKRSVFLPGVKATGLQKIYFFDSLNRKIPLQLPIVHQTRANVAQLKHPQLFYGPHNLIDGWTTTAWHLATPVNMTDSSLLWQQSFVLLNLTKSDGYLISKLAIVNGNTYDSATFYQYKRVKELIVYSSEKPLDTLLLKDSRKIQFHNIDNPVKNSSFSFFINKAYPAEEEVALSEILLFAKDRNRWIVANSQYMQKLKEKNHKSAYKTHLSHYLDQYHQSQMPGILVKGLIRSNGSLFIVKDDSASRTRTELICQWLPNQLTEGYFELQLFGFLKTKKMAVDMATELTETHQAIIGKNARIENGYFITEGFEKIPF